MANKAPAYQYYADKFKAATRHLSRPARDIYREILDWMWLESSDFSSILCTERAVRHAAQCTKREYEKYFLGEIQNPLQPLLKVVGNRYVSNGLRKEADKHAARHGRAVAGANARWGGCLERSPSMAQAQPKQCTPSPSPTPSPAPREGRPDVKPPGAGLEMGLKMVVDAFCDKARWAGKKDRVYTEFRMLLKDFKESDLSAKVAEVVTAGMKPWEFSDAMRGKQAASQNSETKSEFTEAERSAWNKLKSDVRSGRVKWIQAGHGEGRITGVEPAGEYLRTVQNGERMGLDLRAFVEGGWIPSKGPPERAQVKEDAIRLANRKREMQAQKVQILKGVGA